MASIRGVKSVSCPKALCHMARAQWGNQTANHGTRKASLPPHIYSYILQLMWLHGWASSWLNTDFHADNNSLYSVQALVFFLCLYSFMAQSPPDVRLHYCTHGKQKNLYNQECLLDWAPLHKAAGVASVFHLFKRFWHGSPSTGYSG